jgi:hypothetical protein
MDGPSQLGLVRGFYFFLFIGRTSGTLECACRREESKIGRHSAAQHRAGSPGAAYRLIGNAYRAPNGFMILQRTNAALAAAACETAPVRVDCSALHRAPFFHLGGFS